MAVILTPSRARQYLLFILGVVGLWACCLWSLEQFPGELQFFVEIVLVSRLAGWC